MIEYGTTSTNVRVPICCWMDFRNPLIGIAKKRAKIHYMRRKGINLDWVAVGKVTKNLSKNSKAKPLQIVRTQIPLVAANGMTIMKSQGSSLPSVVVHVIRYRGKNSNNKTHEPGDRKITRESLYVACSRATSLNGLYINGKFTPPKAPPKDDAVSVEMTRLRDAPMKFSLRFLQDIPPEFVKIYFHNVQSFISHIPDVICDQCAVGSDIMAFVEPHLLANDQIEDSVRNYICDFRDNCRSTRNSEMALVFRRKEVNTTSARILKYFKPTGHCLFASLSVHDVTVIMTYKSPNYSKSEFVQHLRSLLS